MFLMKLIKIKSRRDFLRIQNNFDIKCFSDNFLILVKKNNDYIKIQNKGTGDSLTRFGFVATKKIDKRAVVRNCIKRKIREIIRVLIKNNKDLFINNIDYEIIAKKTILNTSFVELKNEFLLILNNIKEKNEQNK